MRTRKFRSTVRQILAFVVFLLMLAGLLLLCWGAIELVLWLTPADSRF